jgi:endonuclease/exonuclease/phosphatase family metal-dependent hydrolase
VAARKIFRFLLVVITYLMATSLLLSYLSVYIPPDRFWLPAFFGLAFPYFMAISLLLFLYWLLRLKKESLLLGVVILLGWGHIRHFYSFTQKEKEPPEQGGFTVMTFNVRSFDIYASGTPDHPEEEIISFLRKAKPDILCLQEIYTSPHTVPEKKILSALNYPYHFLSYASSRPNGVRSGMAIFSRYPLRRKKVIRYKGTPNQTQYCDVIIRGDTLRIFNNHLQSTRLGGQEFRLYDPNDETEAIRNVKNISVRLKSAYPLRARQVRILRDSISASPYPVIVCGDFNDTPVSYTYHQLSAGLIDAFVESGKGFGKTYHGKVPSFRIDYILHDKRFYSSGYRTFHNTLSDHFAVMCTISPYQDSLPKE